MGQAWVDMLLTANHKKATILFNGSPLDIERGEFLTSQQNLCARFGWGRQKVRRFLKCLVSDGMVTQKCYTTGTKLTICNYSNIHEIATKQKTNEEPTENQRGTTNNNDNNVITKEYKYISVFRDLWTKYPKKYGKPVALRHFKATVKTLEDCEKIQTALNNYLNSDRVQKQDGKFAQDGKTWFNNWKDWLNPEQERTYEPSCKEL